MKIEGKLIAPSMIYNFKHGIRNLSDLKWVSTSGFRISVAGFLGAAGLVLAVRDGRLRNFSFHFPTWSSDRDGSSEQLLVPGLRNFGNNCFLNVILQALASCSWFQDFMQNTVGECQSLLGEELVESLPFTVALASLLEEIGSLHHGRLVLSPQKLMLVMDHYISNFNLANQQDAEEALLHILSSLRDELSSCYVQNYSSLADVTALPESRILGGDRTAAQTEQERWQRSFLGPFDGITCSTLFCRSCSSQLSLDFQFFHSLHISPVLRFSASIIRPGCSVEDCLKQFFVEERLDNFFCSHCWHGAALKYLSSVDENETDIEKLRRCCDYDTCDCRKLPSLRALPWSNSFSHTFKQLSIARSPKILCIHLQRASMNGFGDLVKLQGHVSFPLILNLYPFVKSGMVTKNPLDRDFPVMQQYQSQPYPNAFHLQHNTNVLQGIYAKTGNILPKTVLKEERVQTATEIISGGAQGQSFEEDPSLHLNGGCSDIKSHDTSVHPNNKVGGNINSTPSGLHIYRLVSVVQHFGRAGSGHYTVYRRVTVSDPQVQSESSVVRWFCISDSEVYIVSENDVLAAEASLLFYEKIAGDSGN